MTSGNYPRISDLVFPHFMYSTGVEKEVLRTDLYRQHENTTSSFLIR